MNGFLIIATGHANYMRMAFNLAFSIKVADMSQRIAIACSKGLQSILTDAQREYVDQFIEVPESMYTINGNIEHPYVKTWMYELSPFEKTVYLDADSVWFHTQKPADLFKLMDGEKVSFQCDKEWDITGEWGCIWNNKHGGLKAIREIYNIPSDRKIYEIQSSFMYFEKSDEAKQFYDFAREAYEKRPFEFFTWANGIPDELVFNISTAVNNIRIKTFPNKPLYFFEYLPTRHRTKILGDYFALSMAGNHLPNDVIEFYNDMVKYSHARHQRIKFPYLWKNKKQFLPERAKV